VPNKEMLESILVALTKGARSVSERIQLASITMRRLRAFRIISVSSTSSCHRPSVTSLARRQALLKVLARSMMYGNHAAVMREERAARTYSPFLPIDRRAAPCSGPILGARCQARHDHNIENDENEELFTVPVTGGRCNCREAGLGHALWSRSLSTMRCRQGPDRFSETLGEIAEPLGVAPEGF